MRKTQQLLKESIKKSRFGTLWSSCSCSSEVWILCSSFLQKPDFKMAPSDPHLLVFTLLQSRLPRLEYVIIKHGRSDGASLRGLDCKRPLLKKKVLRLGLGYKRLWLLSWLSSFGSLPLRKAGCHVMRTLRQPVERRAWKKRDCQPTASEVRPVNNHVSQLGSKSNLKMTAGQQLYKRPQGRTTPLAAFGFLTHRNCEI